jgi:hypothetical protein
MPPTQRRERRDVRYPLNLPVSVKLGDVEMRAHLEVLDTADIVRDAILRQRSPLSVGSLRSQTRVRPRGVISNLLRVVSVTVARFASTVLSLMMRTGALWTVRCTGNPPPWHELGFPIVQIHALKVQRQVNRMALQARLPSTLWLCFVSVCIRNSLPQRRNSFSPLASLSGDKL